MHDAPLPSPPRRRQSLKPSVFWRIAEEIPQSLNWVLVTLSIALPFSLWWIVASSGAINPKFLPSPIQVGQAFIKLWQDGYLLNDTVASFFPSWQRFFAGCSHLSPHRHRDGGLRQYSGAV